MGQFILSGLRIQPCAESNAYLNRSLITVVVLFGCNSHDCRDEKCDPMNGGGTLWL